MKSTLLVVSFLFIALHAAVVNRNLPQILDTPTDTPPCSTNASSAYVDIILLIDTSANMGTANIRKISTTLSLVLPKFTVGQQVDVTQGFRNTRIAVVTFDTQATIAANYTDINSVNDLSNVLNGLSASNSQEANLYDGILKAFYLQTNCSNLFNCTIYNLHFRRPTAMIVFAAAANSNNVTKVPGLVEWADLFENGTIITVNFNTANQDLVNLLKNITYVRYINATMYNFISTSNTLTKDLEWAILQANCFCGDNGGVNTVYYDQANSRYSRYAVCMFLKDLAGAYFNDRGGAYFTDTIGMCAMEPLQVIPAFLLTKQSEMFVQNFWGGNYPFYFGLHQNNQSQWSFYNYDKTEFPVSSYTNWAPGYPKGTDRCAVLDSNDGTTFVWKNYECNALNMILCQAKSCDASSVACCKDCMRNGVSYEKKQKIRTKHRHIMRMKLVNGKPLRTA